jgi:hypothetical protein
MLSEEATKGTQVVSRQAVLEYSDQEKSETE